MNWEALSTIGFLHPYWPRGLWWGLTPALADNGWMVGFTCCPWGYGMSSCKADWLSCMPWERLKCSLWLPWRANPVTGEPQKMHTTWEASLHQVFLCYYSYKWKCLKLKSELRQWDEKHTEGNELFIPSLGSWKCGVGVNLLWTEASGPGLRSTGQDLTLSTPGQAPQLPVNCLENNPNRTLSLLSQRMWKFT